MALWSGLQEGLNHCAGAEVHLGQDGAYGVRLVKLALNKKRISITGKKGYTGSAARITDLVLEGPLALTLMGKGVLVKKTARLEEVASGALQQLFPALKLEDFYVQHFPSGAHSFVAIVRREVADAVIAVFEKQGAEVFMLGLGPFAVDQVIPQLNSYGETLSFDGHELVLNTAQEWVDYRYNPGAAPGFPLKIDMESIPGEYLLAYATAFQLLLHDRLEVTEVASERIRQRLSAFIAGLRFKRYGTAMVFFFFLLLMVNFLVWSAYHSGNEELMGKAGRQSYIFENRAKLEQEVKDKELLVKRLGWNKGYPYAFLCDQIASGLPKEVVLDELQLNPLNGTKTGLIKDAELEPGSVRIKGRAGSVYAINGWMYELKQKGWVKELRLERYMADEQRQTQVFTILLKY